MMNVSTSSVIISLPNCLSLTPRNLKHRSRVSSSPVKIWLNWNFKPTINKTDNKFSFQETKHHLQCRPMLVWHQTWESVAMTYALVVIPLDRRRQAIEPKYRQFLECAPLYLCIIVANLWWLDDEFECFHLHINQVMHRLRRQQDLENAWKISQWIVMLNAFPSLSLLPLQWFHDIPFRAINEQIMIENINTKFMRS